MLVLFCLRDILSIYKNIVTYRLLLYQKAFMTSSAFQMIYHQEQYGRNCLHSIISFKLIFYVWFVSGSIDVDYIDHGTTLNRIYNLRHFSV